MHVQKTTNSPTEVTLTITAAPEDLEPIKQQILKKLSKDVKIPGFRGGKVPPQLVEKHVDQATYQTEFLDEAMTQLYSKALEQEKIRPVTQPKVDVKKFVPFTVLEYEVTAGVFSPVKLGKYRGLKSSIKPKSVTADDVKNVLETLRTRMSERKTVTRAAKTGDEAIIDFKGVDEKKKPINGADGKDYPLTLGSNAFIPGFEDNVIGMKAGAEKTFTLTFPKDYGVKALASKKVTFTVTLKTVNELTKPKADDELAAKTGPFKTLQELKDDIKKQLEHEARHETERAIQNELVGKVVEASEVEIPEAVVEQQVVYELDELRRSLTYRGQTYQEFLEAEGTTEEKYKEETVKPRALQQVKTGVILGQIAEDEKLEVAPEELEQQMQALKAQYKDPAMQAELEKPESRRDIASRILTQKVINLIVEQSV